jgi:hypothetical protein
MRAADLRVLLHPIEARSLGGIGPRPVRDTAGIAAVAAIGQDAGGGVLCLPIPSSPQTNLLVGRGTLQWPAIYSARFFVDAAV